MKAKKRAFTHAHLINVSRDGIWIYTDAQVLEIRCELAGAESACDAQAEMDGLQKYEALQLFWAQQFPANWVELRSPEASFGSIPFSACFGDPRQL